MVAVLEIIGTFTVSLVVIQIIGHYYSGGIKSVLKLVVSTLRALPGVNQLLSKVINKEISGFITELYGNDSIKRSCDAVIPETGLPYDEVMAELKSLKDAEKDVQNKVFAYKYVLDPTGTMQKLQETAIMSFSEKHDVSDNHQKLVEITSSMFMNENALNPVAFPSLRKFELECVAMTANMLNAGPEACGSMTSGGTESILMAVKAYRDLAKHLKPDIDKPEILAPISIHPAFEKAAYYFGLTVVHTELNEHYEADLNALERGITSNTVMIAASAPAYPHGIMDPVEKIGRLAAKYNLPFHVDGCYGGFMLPWLEKLGKPIPKWDFRCHGVTSISADLHKFGYTPKGASVVVYKNESIRKHQFFTYTAWTGGLFGSTTMAGTRSGSVMAAAWVTLKHLGQNGYKEKAAALWETVQKLIQGANSIESIEVIGKPVMNCFAIKSTDDKLNILVFADEMETKGWRMERQQLPDSLHFSILPQHIGQEQQLLDDLAAARDATWNKPVKQGDSAAMYGMIGKIPDQSIVDEFVREYFSKVYM